MYTPVHVINKDSKTAYIAAWQQFLANQHYKVGGIDGIWGQHTTDFTEQFQKDNKLGVDGKVGPATLANAQKQHGFQFPVIQNLEIAGHSNIVIDVSHYQKYNPRTDTDNICFENAYHAGIRAVIHKCSERNGGKDSIDPTYHRRVAKAKAAGLLWGAYHFGGAGSGVEQANYFLNEVGQSDNTVLVLDWETTNMSVADAVAFVTTVHSKTGKYPMLYSRARFINDAHPSSDQLAILSQCPLWLSAYSWKTINPSLPNGWDKYTIWQFSDSIHGHGALPVSGIGDCDRNLFNGAATDLQSFWTTYGIKL